MTPIGFKNGLTVYASDNLIAQAGMHEIKERLGLVRRYPVKVDLSGHTVMVEGDSPEDAIQRYLNRVEKKHG